MKSISNRIYKAIFLISITYIIILAVSVKISNEAFETTMLRVVPNDTPTLDLTPTQKTEGFIWDGKTNKIAFIPAGAPVPANLPAVFAIMGNRITAEIELDEETYLINVQHAPDGTLYWARNISAFELHEVLLQSSLLLIIVLIAIFSLLLAIASSRKIVRPLRQLSGQIADLPVGKAMPPIDVNYTDQELHDIAISFNRFLNELNAYVSREQHLLTLASHELRTPIAVAAGALNVIEKRDQLVENDKVTLNRIKTANKEMAENVRILLSLARNEQNNNSFQIISIKDCVAEILGELPESWKTPQRVYVEACSDSVLVKVQPAMLKMLLRNLIHNALQHTTGKIKVEIFNSEIIISDQGTEAINIPKSTVTQTHAKENINNNTGGLGLYIVTLICERLGWKLNVQNSSGRGNSVHINYSNKQE